MEAPRLRDRPTVVISNGVIGGPVDLLWVVMITSAANRGWTHDLSLEERFAECGLTVPCVVRTAKVSTVEARSVRKVGRLPADLLAIMRTLVARHIS